ncbi:MAG: SDR family oxidoreductase [Crocinitomicaceae bacterium]|nr:SDR family oxidoreductase [Crocinitomicaceae bacterium]
MKNIFITGASEGIGEATARLLHSKGHTLFLTARNSHKLAELKKELGERVFVQALDVMNYRDFSNAVNDAAKKMGSINVMINNAGIGIFEKLANASIEDWHRMIDVNIKGVLNGIHATLPHLMASAGHIINLGSVASHQVFSDSVVYCSTKFAVWAISEGLRIELPDKIRTTTISPGPVNTGFIDHSPGRQSQQNYKDNFIHGLTAAAVAEQIAFAIEAPPEVTISEIVVRATKKNVSSI